MARATQHTSWAAAFGVGAELSRRGYDVTFTLGNTRRIDLLCAVPDGPAFKVQVKGISHENGFRLQQKFVQAVLQRDLFLIVVAVPLDDASPLRFFVLSHSEVIAESSKMPKCKRDGRPYPDGPGLNWGSITPYEDQWSKLPDVTCGMVGLAQ